MCGIYGTTIPYEIEHIEKKLMRSNFRGPDQTGLKRIEAANSAFFTFGHNRLSIIDLDSRSNQPFNYFDRVHLVFNGEIYNFQLLKSDLEEKGHQFKTSSDTEVICATYLQYGTACVEHFIGMFAFVLYDREKNIFFGARDRLGQKPFFYYHNEKEFEFSSQLASLALFNNKLSISSKAIANYLAWGAVPDPDTIYNEVKKLPAGYCFEYTISNGNLKTHQYWDIDYKAQSIYNGNYQDAQDTLENIIEDAVSIRLNADVPVGVFLSGGIDSSLIAALASKRKENVNTFSVKFNEEGFDESKYAEKVAKYLGTNHHVIECNYSEGIDLIDKFTYYYDEPFADSSAIPSLLLAKHTKPHVTVALSGDGGDEGYIGYHRYQWIDYLKRIYTIPYALRIGLAKVLRNLPYYKFGVIASTIVHKDLETAYISVMSHKNTLYMTDIDVFEVFEKIYLFHKNKNIYERASDFDLKTYLNWDINTKVDRATMAFSLEARAPLLDHRVIEFGRSLPTSYKYKAKEQKKILRDILFRHVPKEYFDRPKSGFTMPLREWFKKELKDLVLTELSEKDLEIIPKINSKLVSKLIQEHLNGKSNNNSIIWKLLVLKQWMKNYSQGKSFA